jgi:class 3 adenylate cyclase
VLRVGVNLGDVIAEGSDLYGDGVNVAAWLEALANRDACLSLGKSGRVANKLNLKFDDLGEQDLKNIAEAVRVYRAFDSAPPASGVILRKTVGARSPLSPYFPSPI